MSTVPEELKDVRYLFSEIPEIKLAYLFGSRARGDVGPLSDWDFAVYVDGLDSSQRFDLRLRLIGELCLKLKTNDVDVCVLNDIERPELKYNIVSEGVLLLEREPFKVLVEPRIWNEYFDFHESLVRHGLTKRP